MMGRKNLIWQLYPSYLLVLVAAAVAVHALHNNVLWAGLLLVIGAAVLSWLIARRISRPIITIERVAERFAAGELDLRVPLPDATELAALAGSLNKMATQLGERITTITEQRNELNAVLSSMAEGVFAADNQGRIVSMNPAAARLLGLDPAQARGRRLEEVVHHAELQEYVRQTLAGIQPDEVDLSSLVARGSGLAGKEENPPRDEGSDDGPAAGDEERFFRLHGAGLTDARGRRSGAVIVLNDLTRMRRLEAIRRDFVANVSHELKTPVTSIQGFVEALIEGGAEDPAQRQRYLGIIARHAARLNAIIDDLLTLSRLEEADEHPSRLGPGGWGPGQRALSFDISPIRPVLEEAIDLAAVRAQEKRISIELVCPPELEARINPPLLEQAVLNLIDNAVKYSPEDSHIRVQGSYGEGQAPTRNGTTGGTVVISVLDEGSGIPAQHLARIFERFYVVDKSRSRKLGGTGLGLAIVKHIAQAHGGRVTVQSTPGKGSTFTLHLPA